MEPKDVAALVGDEVIDEVSFSRVEQDEMAVGFRVGDNIDGAAATANGGVRPNLHRPARLRLDGVDEVPRLWQERCRLEQAPLRHPPSPDPVTVRRSR